MTAFAVGYAVPDVPVFVIPALLCLWLFAAAGCEQALRAVARLLPEPAAGAAGAVLGLAALALPAWLAWQHAARVDRSGDRQDALQVERLFEVLPPRSAIVSGDFIADRMLQYERRGRGLPRAREIQIGPRDAAALRALLAVGGAGRRLRAGGRSPPLRGPRLLGDAGGAPRRPRRRSRRRGCRVARWWRWRYRPSTCAASRPTSNRRSAGWARASPPDGRDFVLVGVVGDSTPARLAYGIDAGGARLTLPAGDGVWGHGRSELELVAETGTAAIRLGGRDLVRTAAGVALAVWGPDGQLLRAAALQAVDGYLVPVPAGAFSAYPLIGTVGRAGAGPERVGRRHAVDGQRQRRRAHPGRGPARALRERRRQALAEGAVEHVGRGPVEMKAFETPPGVEPDPAGPPRPPAASVALPDRVCYTSRVAAAASEGTPVSVFLTFGGIPRRAAARIVSSGSDAGSLRGVDTAGLLRGPDRRSAVIRMTRDDQVRLIGHGWSAVETDDAGPYRWTTDREARLVLPPSWPAWRTLTVDAFRPEGDGASALGIRVNGEVLPPQPVQGGWQRYTWTLPPAVTEALGRTSAELSLIVDGPASPRGLAVSAIRFGDAP